MSRRRYQIKRSHSHKLRIAFVTMFFILSGYSLDYAGLSASGNDFATINKAVTKYSIQYRNDYKLYELTVDQIEDAVFATIKHESNFKNDTRSWEKTLGCFSYGLMRIVPSTARDEGWDGKYNSELYNIDTNLKYGIKYLCKKLKKYNQKISMAVAAYNAGGVYMNKDNEYINKPYVSLVYFTYYQGLRQHRKARKS